MTILFALFGIIVHGIFMYKREILFDRKKFKMLLIISFGLFVLRYIFKWMSFYIKGIEMLQVPFMALIIFFIMSFTYNKIYGENPEDTFWSMDWSEMKDGIFNFLYWVIGLMIPMYLAYKVF